ncbi:J domain-containing protein [Engelhardtia mirabilis]|uniref:Chaperone protein DnaJ n=1 Tax=Engelhardtia mirabilis TaxID=2528011 RepID=A0A518BL32_9BACT|nr:Chaperone protein DnaJ [Planctomycetes bacterium Pla133]QDV02004.1 Chaperone protein DnaJ [Planctomycetes bacterium Pla86]
MTDFEPTASPLEWPAGWVRTTSPTRARFDDRLTVAAALSVLRAELDRLGASGVVISSNLQLRLDGLPRSGQGEPRDPGAAVYFRLKGKPHVLACDRWSRVAWNLRAISKHIEALRGMDRWGVGSLERVFTGYQALPAPASAVSLRSWWDVLGVERSATTEQVQAAYRALARERHPDAGGSDALFSELGRARSEALQEISR